MSVITRPAESVLTSTITPECLRDMSPLELPLARDRDQAVPRLERLDDGRSSRLEPRSRGAHRRVGTACSRLPEDAIVWDTGHQAYVHKLVTGRQDRFAGLRQAGGMSGYPNRSESEHDLVENSHASTALSYAYGLASARRLHRDKRRVVAVVGDGALTGGVAVRGAQ